MKEMKYTKSEIRRRDAVLKAVKGGIKRKYEDFTSKLSGDDAGKMGRYVSLEYISNNPHIEWNYRDVSYNPELTLDYVFEHPEKNWDSSKITDIVCTKEKWEYVTDNIDWKWSWRDLSYNIPLDIVRENPGKDWHWGALSGRYSLTEDFIIRFPEKNWNTERFGNRFTKDLVLAVPHLNWDWFCMEQKDYFHWDLVRYHPEKHWAWHDLSKLEGIPSDVFLDNMDKPWNIDSVTKNIIILSDDIPRIRDIEDPRIRYALIGDDIDSEEDMPAFDIFSGIGGEKRERELVLYYCQRHMAAYKIQKLWYRIMYDPSHPIGERVNLRKMFRDWNQIEDGEELERLVAEEVKARRLREARGEPE